MKLTLLAAAWLTGLALAYGWYDAAPAPLLFPVIAALGVAGICRLVKITPLPALLIAVSLLALWRYETVQASPSQLFIEDRASQNFRGRIADDPEVSGGRIRFALELESISRPAPARRDTKLPKSGKILVYAHPPPELVSLRDIPPFRYGDILELSGNLDQPEPIEGFDYPAYLRSKGIQAVLWTSEVAVAAEAETSGGLRASVGELPSRFRGEVYDLRRHLARTLENSLPPTEAALARALILGLREQIPAEVSANFRETGTAHLLAISGLHLGILLLMALGLLQHLLGRHTPAPLLLVLGLIWFYVLLSGAPASVVRAAIMGSIYLSALGLGRPRHSLLPALALSAVVMTALEPHLVSQVSFQLSFAAMGGIALSLPWVDAVSRKIDAGVATTGPGAAAVRVGLQWLTAGTLVSVAATVATFPLVALYFRELPLLGIPTTILATPLLPFALVGGLAVALAGAIHPFLGQLLGVVAVIPLTALLELVEAVPKWVVVFTGEGAAWVWGCYALLLALMVLSESRFYHSNVLARWGRGSDLSNSAVALSTGNPGNGRVVTLGLSGFLLAVTAISLLLQFTAAGDGRLHIYFLDVGQGDSIFVVTPDGRQALVDGGPDFDTASQSIAELMPPWDRSLDLMVMTHLDADHSRGLLRVLENYRIGTVATGQLAPDRALYPQWSQAVQAGNQPVVELTAGQTITLEEGITLRVLHPPAVSPRGAGWDSNNKSVVLQLVYGDVSFLLTGDIEAEAERFLARNGNSLKSDVLKAGHHGSKSSTTDGFLGAVTPRWVVISAGLDNQYGHPHPEVVERLESMVGERGIFSTATMGTIDFSTDGVRLWVDTER